MLGCYCASGRIPEWFGLETYPVLLPAMDGDTIP